ncbi:FMN-dependent NADH-azoreductase [Xanthomonas floridensis]|uniref:FMN dependent NADH:quinone oxidoreductase n=1 Tax=Xanthomonas floridensis TaxID=1843580 RepID=A0A1A9M772_9XANT|nr:NAD(P)H-dependent oxidoreductase [Xanthomonas floridensis]MEA5122647.1 NAD(P)H-dependent oxidoreductase [Xanthomonas floridensis]MEA5131313.1 NAD(P)H-dependent oxidoreductase [Xanthomonas floridensis]OAG66175.1 FMN-dependent NADH-azoreductase [Xanthomonas floridensis]
MRLLHLDSSILSTASVSRQLTAHLVQALRASLPTLSVSYRDLAAAPVAHLTGAIAAGFRPLPQPASDTALVAEHALSEQLVEEFLTSEIVVMGAPMYNFSVPTQLKAWIDRIAQPGRTFQYTATGPQGLAVGKRLIVASTRGGIYTQGAMAALDFQEAYLTAAFGFLGVHDVQFVRAENLSRGPELAAISLTNAQACVAAVVRRCVAQTHGEA